MLLFIILTAISWAASYNPDLTWRTLKTEHFNIHFHGGEEQLAEEMAVIVEDVYDKMTPELQWVPKRPTEVVLVDNTDNANGYAMYLPVNTIVIFVTAPDGSSTLSLYEDWNDAIFTHEYTHTLHLDTIEGLPAQLRKVFGRIIAINGLAPNWVVEGQATMQETWHTNAGRGRASIPDMIKRTATLYDEFPPLGNMDGFQTENPGGNLRYLFGQDFMNYIAEQRGDQVWTDWNHSYGGGIPYFLPANKVLGDRLPVLYKDWKTSVEARYQKQKEVIEAQGLSEYTLLTDNDENCMSGTYSPDGSKMVYSCYNLHSGSNVYLATATGEQETIEIKGVFGRYFGWRQDGQAFAYAASRTVNRFNLYKDIYLHSVGGGTKMLTQAKRARDPEFRRDGQQLLVVTNEVQNNQLETLTIDQRLTPLTENTNHTQYSTPRFSPDGKWIAVSAWIDGQRDLWIFDSEGKPVRRVTSDIALDVEPRWSPNGQRLYFASDRTGVFNIFAIDLQTEHLHQVTNVLTGAFAPSISYDEQHLLFTVYQPHGFSIATMPLEPEQWIDAGFLPAPLTYALPLSSVSQNVSPPAVPKEWSPSPRQFKWWELYEKRRHSKGTKASSLDLTLHTETLQYNGLTGLGSAIDPLLQQQGYIGLPHEPQYWGEEPNTGPDIQEEATVVEEEKEEIDYPFTHPVERYNSLSTLFPPRYISPTIYQTGFGYMGALATSSTDILRRHFYSANVTYRTDSEFIGWGAAYTLNRFIPIYSAGIYSYTVPYNNVYTYQGAPSTGGSWVPTVENSGQRYWDKRIRGYVQVSYAKNAYQSYFARWSGEFRSPWIPSDTGFGNAGLPVNAYRPYLPSRGVLSGIGGGWRYVKGASYSRSISPENTRLISIVGQFQSPYLGSYTLDDNDQPIPFTRLQLTGEWREYKTLPWSRNHVLALKMATGVSAGDTQRYGSFRLGGSFGESGYYTLPDEWRALRGFDPASVSGDGYYLGSVEYRLPVWWADFGYQTYPVFLRYISASAFVDFGNAYDEFTDAGGPPLVGMGAELSASLIVSWGAPIRVRAGYAFGANGGIPIGSLDGFYTWFGSSF